MVTIGQLQPILDLIAETADADAALEAIEALEEFALAPDVWAAASAPLVALIEDPRFRSSRGRLFRLLTGVPAASETLAAIAHDPTSPDHPVALDALARSDPATWSGPLARWLIDRLDAHPEFAERLAALPVEDVAVGIGELAPLLAHESRDVQFFGAVAMARVGTVGALDERLDVFGTGDVPEWMWGSPFVVYTRVAAVRPLPPALVRHLTTRLTSVPHLADVEAPSSSLAHIHDVVVWALTGVADAEGTLLLDGPDRAEPAVPDQRSVTTLEADALAREVAKSSIGELMQLGDDAYRRLAGLSPRAAARLLQDLVATVAAVSADGNESLFAGNALMRLVAIVPRPVPLNVLAVVETWRRGSAPEDQLAALLSLADDDALLDAFAPELQSPDGAARADAARLLHQALAQHHLPLPFHGDGDGGPAPIIDLVPDRPDTRFIPRMAAAMGAEGFAMAEPPPADDAMTMAEAPSDDAMTMAEPPADDAMTMAEPPADVEMTIAEGPAETPEVRRLQAEITETASGKRRRHAFAPGTAHTLGVHIGPGAAGALSADAFPEADVHFDTAVGALLDVELVTTGPDGTARQHQPMVLPPSGATAQARFALPVAAGATEVTCSVLVFQGARLLQSAEIRGPVAKKDAKVAGEGIRFVRTADLATTSVERSAPIDASLSFHVGSAGEALLVGGDGPSRIISIGGLAELQTQIRMLLMQAANVDADDGLDHGSDTDSAGSPGSEQQVELMRGLARVGNMLHQRLRPQLGGVSIEHTVQVTTADDDVIPIEMVYDFGFPSSKAGLCKNWQKALVDGRCPTCRPRDGKTRVVCPMGFWGVRLMVERQLATSGGQAGDASPVGQPRPGLDTLPAIDRVLFAASDRVDGISKAQRQRTIDLLHERLGDRCRTADSWRAWRKAIPEHRPGLLITLPHNEGAPDGLRMLEIGHRSHLDIGAVTSDYVVAADAAVGPVVLLLGCDTAHADVSWQSAASAFRRRGAAVVVGTLVQALGRQTAPMTRLIADALWGPDAVTSTTVGEVVRSVRRRLIAQGMTLGMSLVAFGDADWLITSEGN
jgi:hypothetical protein